MYPCKDCILLCNCSESCHSLLNDVSLLRAMITDKFCPDCGHYEVKVHFQYSVGSQVESIDKFSIMCNNCSLKVFIWMNINNKVTIKYLELTSVMRLPITTRQLTFVWNQSIIAHHGTFNIPMTLMGYDTLIDKYLLPAITTKYGDVSDNLYGDVSNHLWGVNTIWNKIGGMEHV